MAKSIAITIGTKGKGGEYRDVERVTIPVSRIVGQWAVHRLYLECEYGVARLADGMYQVSHIHTGYTIAYARIPRYGVTFKQACVLMDALSTIPLFTTTTEMQPYKERLRRIIDEWEGDDA